MGGPLVRCKFLVGSFEVFEWIYGFLPQTKMVCTSFCLAGSKHANSNYRR